MDKKVQLRASNLYSFSCLLCHAISIFRSIKVTQHWVCILVVVWRPTILRRKFFCNRFPEREESFSKEFIRFSKLDNKKIYKSKSECKLCSQFWRIRIIIICSSISKGFLNCVLYKIVKKSVCWHSTYITAYSDFLVSFRC